MFGTKKKADPYPMLALAAHSIDQIDQNECATQIVATCVATMLLQLGYKEVDSYASASTNMAAISNIFATEYWKSAEYSHKVSTLMVAVRMAIDTIEKGSIDERVKKVTADTLKKEHQKNT